MEKARISALLRSQRSLCGLTVDEVVERLKQFGIELSPKTLYGYENGVSMPNVPIFIALCDIYHVGNIIGAVSGDAPQKIPPATLAKEDWTVDQYNDFFNAKGILEKVFLLMDWGIPSFSGYESKLADCFPSNAEAANFDKLYSAFMKLDELTQGIILDQIESLANNPKNCKEKYRSSAPTAKSGA